MPMIYTQTDFKKIAAQVLTDWDKLGLPKVDQTKLDFKLMPIRKIGLHSLLTFMIYHAGKPAVVLKLPRYREGTIAFAALRNEAAKLKELRGGPQLFRLIEIDSVPVLLMRGYEGKMLHQYIDAENDLAKVARFLRIGVDLLTTYSARTKGKKLVINDSFIEQRLLRPVREILEYYPNQIAHLEKYLNEFLAVKSWAGQTVPEVLVHHEYNPWNILLTPEGDLILLDWEDAQNNGLPFLDLYNFFMVAFRIMFYGETNETQQRPLADRQARARFLIDEFRAASRKYCLALSCQESVLDLFFLIFAIEQTRFFLNEKRRDVHYAESWLSLLTNTAVTDCFVDHLSREIQ
ncbi:MAG: phosphotransferase [Candidatus Margulisiibacteriota bacterium]|jgi:thiamine kinase-like enzyme